jgi:hypothetical protein
MNYGIKHIISKDRLIDEYELYQFNEPEEKSLLGNFEDRYSCLEFILKNENIIINDFKKQVPNPEHEFVQIKHPISNEWNLIDKSIGQFVGRSKKKFKGIPVK